MAQGVDDQSKAAGDPAIEGEKADPAEKAGGEPTGPAAPPGAGTDTKTSSNDTSTGVGGLRRAERGAGRSLDILCVAHRRTRRARDSGRHPHQIDSQPANPVQHGVVLAIVGGVVSAAVLIWPKHRHAKKVLAIGVGAAVLGVCVSVGCGIFSFSMREAPSLDLVVTQTTANTLHVTVDASAISLKSDESMLLRVITLPDAAPAEPVQVLSRLDATAGGPAAGGDDSAVG